MNMASWDRALRILVGIVLLTATIGGALGVWGWLGVIPLVTGLSGNCPVYSAFRFGTRRVKSGA